MLEDRDDFYLTLPSNGAISTREFPNNRNNSWKTRLNRPLKLEGEWEVGLVNISYPSESKLKDYLLGLKDEDILLSTGRYVEDHITYDWKKRYQVTYGDIKKYQLTTLKDLFIALFKEEYLKMIEGLGKNVPLTGQVYEAPYGQTTVTSADDSFTINRTTLGSIANYTHAESTIFVQFPVDFLLTFDFLTEESSGVYKPTKNLNIEFADDTRGFNKDHRSYGFNYVSYSKSIIFYYDINVTFLNLKNLSHNKSEEPRSLFVYCSLCDPQTVGEDTQQLLCHSNYVPSLKGGSTYEPKTVVYRGLRVLQFITVEIKVKEEDEEHLAKFSSGASIAVLHLRRR